jgi:hypothetical protein
MGESSRAQNGSTRWASVKEQRKKASTEMSDAPDVTFFFRRCRHLSTRYQGSSELGNRLH